MLKEDKNQTVCAIDEIVFSAIRNVFRRVVDAGKNRS
jgi:hypothetical protein